MPACLRASPPCSRLPTPPLYQLEFTWRNRSHPMCFKQRELNKENWLPRRWKGREAKQGTRGNPEINRSRKVLPTPGPEEQQAELGYRSPEDGAVQRVLPAGARSIKRESVRLRSESGVSCRWLAGCRKQRKEEGNSPASHPLLLTKHPSTSPWTRGQKSWRCSSL